MDDNIKHNHYVQMSPDSPGEGGKGAKLRENKGDVRADLLLSEHNFSIYICIRQNRIESTNAAVISVREKSESIFVAITTTNICFTLGPSPTHNMFLIKIGVNAFPLPLRLICWPI